MCLFFLKDYDKALAYFFKVEYLDENNVLAQQSIARCYFQKQQFTETIRFYKKLIQNQHRRLVELRGCIPDMRKHPSESGMLQASGRTTSVARKFRTALSQISPDID